MKLTAKKAFKLRGVPVLRGQHFETDQNTGRILTVVGKAVKYTEPPAPPKIKTEKPKARRTYKRRDMVASDD